MMKIYQLVLIVISIILIKSLFSKNKKEENTYDIPRQIKKDLIINNEPEKKVEKRVTFNLEKNKVYEIKKYDKNIEHSKDTYFYGDDIINNNAQNKEKLNPNTDNPQQVLLNRLHNKKDDIQEKTKDIFSYWENLNIGNFTEREYSNAQVNDFNLFNINNNQFQNKEISQVYDELTKGRTNPLTNYNDDKSINNNLIDGFSSKCKYHTLNNIEN